ncbi:MAG: anhydro-N-acetylmuramic acid kinase [Ferruginibacter sp.]|nr:anhydro-N-acetylmuramic acid kinase [Ferruginibacter sp.]
MNRNISKLAEIAEKKSRRIIGLMSGTSLDGLDIALCDIEGSGMSTSLRLVHFVTIAYSVDFKKEVRSIFSKETVSLQRLCLLNEWIAEQHAKMINDSLEQWNIDPHMIDLIASHGQTIYHAPKHLHGLEKFGNATLQIGDGDHLSVKTGVICISDFRQKHLAAGGEGAPLAAYGDYLLFKDAEKDVILLNIGGIANFSFIPANTKTKQMFSTDIGPGNTLMDAWMQQHFAGETFDKDAQIGQSGVADDDLLQSLAGDDFFAREFPKTTGPELFNLVWLQSAIQKSGKENISVENVMATLNKLTASSIAAAIKPFATEAGIIYVSGGGMHNPLLMKNLRVLLPGMKILSSSEKDINPDAKEAILFAILANEAVAGDPRVFAAAGDCFPAISMGKISFPY